MSARVRSLRAALVAIACALTLGACADFDASLDPTFGLGDVVVARPTLSQDIQPIFDARCAFGGCHSDASRQAGLVLTAGRAHGALVGRRSSLRPAQTLVVAGDSAASWLLVMLGDDERRRAGVVRMPLAASPLTPNQRATIANWIAAGAPR
jgi:hypothetical protein